MCTFAERLKELRTSQGITGSQLGDKLNLTKSGISSYERRGSFPDEDMLKKIANYFNCSVDYLIGFSDVSNPVVNDNTKSFTVDLVKQLLENRILDDGNNIDENIVNMIKSALLLDIKNKNETNL